MSEQEKLRVDTTASVGDPRQLTMSFLVTPSMVNFNNVMHGGELLNLLDKVAYVCSSRYCGCGTVTLSVDRVLFKHPIPIGTLVTFYASINYVGTKSCEVGIKVVCEDFKAKTAVHTNSCYFTMVAMKDGKTMPMPPFIPQTDKEKERHERAIRRKEMLKRTQKAALKEEQERLTQAQQSS
ncbi:acyl-CoA thioesterase [Helicobacter felis]|uniref:Acyl-CoA thioester hydrolase n=1 Tax=Helicobacter felis (strain ATCC 49179 / CCUG 28539 / NCTC 12436 / CS1) TaxID=936155 RepID=E7ABT5_HELFC|nr:acyl-CoA thioesterase [Helicobacter felis]CBY82908.1 putative acyl-CoA thioester hydrolase [Helicobacter felis ATCC 49179]